MVYLWAEHVFIPEHYIIYVEIDNIYYSSFWMIENNVVVLLLFFQALLLQGINMFSLSIPSTM